MLLFYSHILPALPEDLNTGSGEKSKQVAASFFWSSLAQITERLSFCSDSIPGYFQITFCHQTAQAKLWAWQLCYLILTWTLIKVNRRYSQSTVGYLDSLLPFYSKLKLCSLRLHSSLWHKIFLMPSSSVEPLRSLCVPPLITIYFISIHFFFFLNKIFTVKRHSHTKTLGQYMCSSAFT